MNDHSLCSSYFIPHPIKWVKSKVNITSDVNVCVYIAAILFHLYQYHPVPSILSTSPPKKVRSHEMFPGAGALKYINGVHMCEQKIVKKGCFFTFLRGIFITFFVHTLVHQHTWLSAPTPGSVVMHAQYYLLICFIQLYGNKPLRTVITINNNSKKEVWAKVNGCCYDLEVL